jgi:hypothetical protein
VAELGEELQHLLANELGGVSWENEGGIVYGSKYLTGLGERVVDIEQQHRVLDWALVERGVDRCGGGHVEAGAV